MNVNLLPVLNRTWLSKIYTATGYGPNRATGDLGKPIGKEMLFKAIKHCWTDDVNAHTYKNKSVEKIITGLFFTFQRKFVFLALSNAKCGNSSCCVR